MYMTKETKCKLVTIVIVTVLLVWILQYCSLNKYYKTLSNNVKEIYQTGEVVPFDTDYINKGMQANGYAIRVDSFRIECYQDYINSINLTVDNPRVTPEKIALVEISVLNQDSCAEGIMLTAFSLHGVDNYVGLNRELLSLLNPGLAGNYGIRLDPGEQYTIFLPYNLIASQFGASDWRNIYEYQFYLHITSYPTEKDIRLTLFE